MHEHVDTNWLVIMRILSLFSLTYCLVGTNRYTVHTEAERDGGFFFFIKLNILHKVCEVR